MRDPSHTIALTHDELIALGNNNSSIIRSQVIDFKLKYDAESLIDRAFPETVTHKELLELLTNDIGKNEIGFSPTLEGKKLKTVKFADVDLLEKIEYYKSKI